MDWVAAVAVSVSVLVALVVCCAVWLRQETRRAHRYAVTLVRNEGAFVGLCIRRRWDTWTFVDVKIVPQNPGAAVVAAAPGELYVPKRNILYYQEIANVVE